MNPHRLYQRKGHGAIDDDVHPTPSDIYSFQDDVEAGLYSHSLGKNDINSRPEDVEILSQYLIPQHQVQL